MYLKRLYNMYSKRNHTKKEDGVTHLELIDIRGVVRVCVYGEGERVTTHPFWIHLLIIYEVVGKRSPQLEPFFFFLFVKSHLERPPPPLKTSFLRPWDTFIYKCTHIVTM